MISKTTTTLTIGYSRLECGTTLQQAAKEIRLWVKDHAPKRVKVKYNPPLTIDVTFQHSADAVLFNIRYHDWLSTTAAELERFGRINRRFLTGYKPQYDALSAESQIHMMSQLLTSWFFDHPDPPTNRLRKKLLMEGMGWIATEAGWKHPSGIKLAA